MRTPGVFACTIACVLLSACTPGVVFPSGAPATATPTPTPIPTPTPMALTANPTTLALSGAGATFAQTTQVQETGYSGLFSENSTCSGIATVSPSSGNGPSATLTVTGVASGSCAATVSDANGQHVTVNITVTVTNIGVYAHGRR